MNCAVYRLNSLLHTMDGHFVIRNNALFIYDEEDHLDLIIPSYLLQSHSPKSDSIKEDSKNVTDGFPAELML